MPSFETMPPNVGKPSEKKSGKWEKIGRNLVVAAALTSPMAVAAEKGETAASLETARTEQILPKKEADPKKREEIERELNKAQAFMLEKVDGLGLFTGTSFVNEVKKNGGSIRAFLDNPASLPACSGLLGEILKQYVKPLALAKQESPELYREKTDQFKQVLMVIETAALTKIKGQLLALY